MIIDLFFGLVKNIILIPINLMDTLFLMSPEPMIQTLEWGAQYISYANGELPLVADPSMTGPAGIFGIYDLLVFSGAFLMSFFFIKITLKFLTAVLPWLRFDILNFDNLTSHGGKSVGGTFRDGTPIKTWWSRSQGETRSTKVRR